MTEDGVRPEFIDVDGNPMTFSAWMDLYSRTRNAGRVLAQMEVILPSGFRDEVCTSWVGTNNPEHEMYPFVTSVGIGARYRRAVRFYLSKEAALAGHEDVIAKLKAGQPLDDPDQPRAVGE